MRRQLRATENAASCFFVRVLFFAASLLAGSAYAELPLPIEPGTTWRYAHAEQTAESAGANTDIIMRIAGTQEFAGKQLLRFETLTGETVTRTELLEVSERGILCYARSLRGEELAKLQPAETLLAWPLQTGAAWDTEGMAADLRMHQHFSVVGEEDVYVPAGKFHAFHLHCDGSALTAVSIDRWFVPGTGFVRDVTTMRGPGGTLLQRSTTELAARPEVLVLPSPTPTPTATATMTPEPTASASSLSDEPEVSTPTDRKRLTVEVSADAAGGMETEFHSDTKNIYVRWHGHGLPKDAKVRVAWVAEDVGDLVDPNFIVDQTETMAPAPDASARFTLGRPEDGWAEGKYRVEFYVNDELVRMVRVRILP